VQRTTSTGPSWSLLLSFVSLLVSAFALWFASVAPADIKVSLGPELTFCVQRPKGPPPGPHWVAEGLAIIAHCEFANNGAKTGEINGLSLQFEAEDGTTWKFVPRWIVDEDKLASEVSAQPPGELGIGKVTTTVFHAVVLPGKQTTSHSYLFLGSNTDSLTTPHTLKVTLRSLSPGDHELRLQQRLTLKLDAFTISTIPMGTITSVPFEESKLVY
jgi:hypothetical protein